MVGYILKVINAITFLDILLSEPLVILLYIQKKG